MTNHKTLDQAFKWSKHSHTRNKLTNSYEPLQPYLFGELAKSLEMRALVGIGANIGFYSIVLADYMQAEKVFAFEPMPGPFAELTENIVLNSLTHKIKSVQVALSDERGKAEIAVISEFSGANALTSSTIHRDKKPIRLQIVETEKLDNIINSTGESIAIKIDVEGHERTVIQGARNVLQENCCLIQIEDYMGGVAAELLKLGYERIFSAGPDHYFTNYAGANQVIKPALEAAVSKYIQNHKATPAESEKGRIRRRIFPGVTIELSQAVSRKVRKLARAIAFSFRSMK